MNEVLDQAREVVARIPKAARPLVFIVLPLAIVHAIFTRTPESPLPPLAGPISESSIPRYRLPRVDDIVWAIEGTSDFRNEKFAICPLAAPEHVMAASPIFRALQDAGYIKAAVDTESAQTLMRIDVTPQGRAELGSDLRDLGGSVMLRLARKKITRIVSMEMPPRGGRSDLPDRVRISFVWQWVPSNPIASGLLPQNSGMLGVAF